MILSSIHFREIEVNSLKIRIPNFGLLKIRAVRSKKIINGSFLLKLNAFSDLTKQVSNPDLGPSIIETCTALR